MRGWAVTLALALHVPLYLLLRMEGEPMPVAPASGADQRIRLAWSERAPPPRPTALPPQPPRAAPLAARNTSLGPVTAPVAVPAPDLVLTPESDAWAHPSGRAATADGGVVFARDIFARGRGTGFDPVRRMPGVRLHDSSILGRLDAEARRRACGSLRGALAARPESTAAIMASMKRWDCGL